MICIIVSWSFHHPPLCDLLIYWLIDWAVKSIKFPSCVVHHQSTYQLSICITVDSFSGLAFVGVSLGFPSAYVMEVIGIPGSLTLALVLTVGSSLLLWSTTFYKDFYSQNFYIMAGYFFLFGEFNGICGIKAEFEVFRSPLELHVDFLPRCLQFVLSFHCESLLRYSDELMHTIL